MRREEDSPLARQMRRALQRGQTSHSQLVGAEKLIGPLYSVLQGVCRNGEYMHFRSGNYEPKSTA
jgi:hypothetical protein